LSQIIGSVPRNHHQNYESYNPVSYALDQTS